MSDVFSRLADFASGLRALLFVGAASVASTPPANAAETGKAMFFFAELTAPCAFGAIIPSAYIFSTGALSGGPLNTTPKIGGEFLADGGNKREIPPVEGYRPARLGQPDLLPTTRKESPHAVS